MEPFSKRNRQKQDTGPYIYDQLPQPLRIQIVHIFEDLVNSFIAAQMRGSDPYYGPIALALRKERGVFQLIKDPSSPADEVLNYFIQERDIAKCLDVIEIVFAKIVSYADGDYSNNFSTFDAVRNGSAELNARFQEHRVGYEFRDGQIIRIDSAFAHSEVVEPALALLHERYLKGANDEFLKAHEHFRHGRFAETINECLKAFESTMKAICHKRGWQYNQNDTAKKLLDVCDKNGLFPAYMQSSLSGLRAAMESVPTVRNKLTAHGQGVQPVQISKDVAAFVLHSTASNILFLASLEKH